MEGRGNKRGGGRRGGKRKLCIETRIQTFTVKYN